MQISNTNEAVMQSIISRAEEHIMDATGKNVRLYVINPNVDMSPIEIDPMNKLAIQLTNIWKVQLRQLSIRSREEQVVIRKQIFTMIYKEHNKDFKLKSIAKYLGGYHHSAVIHWLKCGTDSLKVKDYKFMKHFEPVKHLYYADTH